LDLVAREHARDVRLHARMDVLAEHLGDGVPEHALLRDAEPVVVGAVAEAEAAFAIEVRDEGRHVVRDQAQPLLAFAQRLLEPRVISTATQSSSAEPATSASSSTPGGQGVPASTPRSPSAISAPEAAISTHVPMTTSADASGMSSRRIIGESGALKSILSVH